jgi:CrcB protein
MMTSLFLVALGGAAGSVVRHLIATAVGFPWGTLAVNVIGSFAIGILWVVLAGRFPGHGLLVTGFLGGFTTFSAFSLDTLRLIELGQTGQAMVYVTASVGLSLAACTVGLFLARGVAT